MSTNGGYITEDAEMAESDGDKIVTMVDVLREEQDFEEDANAVLGASDDKNCTYTKGYIKRQAIYACLTCCTDAKEDPTKRAGVCLACSLTCHENHELVELYTKRNFRCDCGNPKFKSHPCQFNANKPDLNDDNKYNQNFSGLYCICNRPYPDPEATCEDDMIQCIICEDWLHSSHLEATVPPNDQYAEMICKSCMEKNEFLHDYSGIVVNSEIGHIDILTFNGNSTSVHKGYLAGENLMDKNELPDMTDDEIMNKTDIEITEGKVEPSVHHNSEQNRSAPMKIDSTTKEIRNLDIEMDENFSPSVDTTYKAACMLDDNTSCSNVEQSKQDNITTELIKESAVPNNKTMIAEPNHESVTIKTSDNGPPLLEDTAPDKVKISENVNKQKQEKENLDVEKKEKIDTDIEQKSEQNNKQLSITDKQLITDIENITDEKKKEVKPMTGSEEKLDRNTGEETSSNNEQDKFCSEHVKVNNPDQIKAMEIKSKPNETFENVSTNELDIPNKECEVDTFIEKMKDNRKHCEPSVKEGDQQLLNKMNAMTESSTPNKQDLDKKPIEEATIENELKEGTGQTNEGSIISTNCEESVEKPKTDIDNFGVKEPMDKSEVAETSQNQFDKDNDKTDAVMSAIDEILKGTSDSQTTHTAEKITTPSEESDSIMTENINEVKTCEHNEPNKKPDDVEPLNTASKDVEMSGEEVTPSENNICNEHIATDKNNIDKIESDIEDKADSETLGEKDPQYIPTSEVQENLDTAHDKTDGLTKNNHIAKKNEPTDTKNAPPIETVKENKRKLDTDLESVSVKKAKLDEEKPCIRPRNVKRVFKGATFWPSYFRQKLCTCGDCISMYKDLNVLFLTDNEDTVTAYESLGKENIGISQYEKGLEALSSLDRIQQINALTEYNKMRDKLLDFLKSFKDRKEIVKEEDIKAFFAGMKPRREPDGVYFCR